MQPGDSTQDNKTHSADAADVGGGNGVRSARLVGGIPTLPLVVSFVAVVGVALVVSSFVPPYMAAERNTRAAALREHDLLLESLTKQMNDFVAIASNVPNTSGRTLLRIDPRNEESALAFLLLAADACAPACTSLYYGLNSSDNYFHLLSRTDGATQIWRRIPSNGSHEKRLIVNETGAFPKVGELLSVGPPFVPKNRPWWNEIASGRLWVPVYVDFSSGLAVATAGRPIYDETSGEIIAIFAADYSFESVFHGLDRQSDDERAVAVYEAYTHNVLFTSWAQTVPTGRLLRLNESTDPMVKEALREFSKSTLDDATAHTVQIGEGPSAMFASSVPVGAERAGAQLRLLVAVRATEAAARLRRSLTTSVSIAAVACVITLLLLVGAAIGGFERPLGRMADDIGERARRALTGIETEADAEGDTAVRAKPALRELRVIEHAFDDLVYELERVRSFLPEGCFLRESMWDEAEGEGEEIETPEPDRDFEKPEDEFSRRTSRNLTLLSVVNPLDEKHADDDLSSIASGSGRVEQRPSGDDGASRVTPARSTHSSRRGSQSGQTPRTSRLTQLAAQSHGSGTSLLSEGGRFLRHMAAITVLLVEVRELSLVFGELGPGAASTRLCETIAQIFESAASAYNATVEHFAGDRATLIFNATRPNTSHRRAAMECAVAVSTAVRGIVTGHPSGSVAIARDAVRRLQVRPHLLHESPIIVPLLPNGVAGGAASGPAHVGNVGSSGLTRFSVVAPHVFRTAETLLRFCAEPPPSAFAGPVPPSTPPLQCVADGSFAPDMHQAVAFQAVGARSTAVAASLTPVASATKQPGPRPTSLIVSPMRMLVDKLSGSDGAGDGEWMYELQRAEAANEYNDINAAFNSFSRGDIAEATRRLKVAQARSDAAAAAYGIQALQALLWSVS